MYPAGAPDITVRVVTLPSGILIRVIESGPSSGRAVVLVHGWGSCVYSFSEQIPALAAEGYRAVALDLPGHGLSEKPLDESHYSTAALASAVLGVADALEIDRFTFLGHSMGGALGLRMVEGRERRIERLIVVSAASLGAAPVIGLAKLLSPRFINRIIPVMLTRGTITLVLRVAYGTANRPTQTDVDQYWATTQFDEGAWACRALLHRFTFDAIPDETLRAMRIPVLVLLGGRDRLVLGGAGRAALIPKGRTVTIPAGGHLLMQECAREANAEILDFLSAQLDSVSDK